MNASKKAFPKPLPIMEYSDLLLALGPFYEPSTRRAITRQVQVLEPDSRNKQILALRWVLIHFLEEKPDLHPITWYAMIFGVHKQQVSTVFRNKNNYPRKQGKQMILTAEQEIKVANYIKEVANKHEQPTTRDILQYVEMQFAVPVTKGWLQKFLIRQQGAFARISATAQEESRLTVTKESTTVYLNLLNDHVENVCSELFFNLDEVGYSPWADRASKAVIVPRELLETRVQFGVDRSKKNSSCLACISCAGDAILPLLVIHRATIDAEVFSDGFRNDEDMMVRHSPTAYVTGEIFIEWIKNSFIPYVENVREAKGIGNEPAVLLSDNCSIHVTPEVKELLGRNHIKFITMPPHSSNVFQPLDLVTFSSFKAHMKTAHTSFAKGSQADSIHKINRALEMATISSTNRHAFSAAGFKIDYNTQPNRVRINMDLLNERIEKMNFPTEQDLINQGKRIPRSTFGFVNIEEYVAP